MLQKLLKIASKSSAGRNYSNGIHMTDHNGRQVYTYTNGFYVMVVSNQSQDCRMDPYTAMIRTTHDGPCCSVSEYPQIEPVLGCKPDYVGGSDEEAIKAGCKILIAMSQTKIQKGKTYINPVTAEISHDGEKPGTINAQWLADFLTLSENKNFGMAYYGIRKDDLHHFTVFGNKGEFANFFCLAVVDK